MRLVLALALAATALALPPAAAAGCDATGTVCDSSYSDGYPCAEGGVESRSTTSPVFTGSSYCSGPGYSGEDFTAAGGLVGWSKVSYDDPENGRGGSCAIFVAGEILPCVVEPPNPGWGDVVP